MKEPSVDRYAVMGNPVAHSRSPDIHAAFAAQTGQHMSYERLLIPLDAFVPGVQSFRSEGGRGLNITVPFKMEAHALANHPQLRIHLTDRAALAGAANTLRFDAEGIHGDNTDGVGLVRDIQRLGYSLRGQRVLLLGAGGATRGVIGPILAEQPQSLTIANRSVDKARLLADIFATSAQSAKPIAASFNDLAGQHFDLIINATSASLSGAELVLPDGLFKGVKLAYDMMYGATPTAFLSSALHQGASRVADGLGMLIEQAAESFYFWRGVRPDTAPVHALMRTALQTGD